MEYKGCSFSKNKNKDGGVKIENHEVLMSDPFQHLG